MKTIYAPIVQTHSTTTGMPMDVACLTGAIADDLGQIGPIGLAMVRYAAKGGVVKLAHAPVGTLDLVDASTFSLKMNSAAKRMLDTGVITTLAVELDARGEVLETWLADKAQTVTKIADVVFQKQQQRLGFAKSAGPNQQVEKPMTAEQLLEQAIAKCYANPLSLRKDSAIELNPPAKTPSRTPTAPKGTIDVAELARANDKIRVLGEHLQAAMRSNPGSVKIADAGLAWYALTNLGLGIDSRYMGGTQSVGVASDGQSEYLRDAWAGIAGKSAGVTFDRGFRKAVADTRRGVGAMIISKTADGRVSARPFSKAADASADDGGSSEAAQLLRRHSLETGLAHMKILSDKIKAAMTAVGSDSMASPHLSSAHLAAVEARAHMERCLKDEDEN